MPQITQHIDDSIQQHAPIVDRRNVLNQREHIETQQPHFNIAILGNADTGKSTLIDAYMSGYHGGEGETPGSFGLARVLHRWQKFIDTREESSISNRRRHRERRVPFLIWDMKGLDRLEDNIKYFLKRSRTRQLQQDARTHFMGSRAADINNTLTDPDNMPLEIQHQHHDFFYRGGFILCYDLTEPDSIYGAKRWFQYINELHPEGVPITLIGTKADSLTSLSLCSNGMKPVSVVCGENMAKNWNIPFYIVSAIKDGQRGAVWSIFAPDGQNTNQSTISDVFQELVYRIIENYQEKELLKSYIVIPSSKDEPHRNRDEEYNICCIN